MLVFRVFLEGKSPFSFAWNKEHPFKVERNQELFELRRSIQQEGILVPLLVRKNPDGEGFEIIAGHRRKENALWAGVNEVPAIILRWMMIRQSLR